MENKINDLLNIFNVHKKELDAFISNQVKHVALEIDQACNYPNIAVPIENFYKKLRIDKYMIKEIIDLFILEVKKTKQIKNVLLASDDKTHFLILCMMFYIQKQDLSTALRCNLLLLAKHYGNLMKKYLKVCDPNNFYKTLDHLSKTHLFVKYNKSILQGLLHLNRELYKKYKNYIKVYNPEKIFLFIYEGRHRVNQSCKSFTNKYIELIKSGTSKSVDDQSDYIRDSIKEDEKLKIIYKATTNLITYKTIYKQAIDITNLTTKLNKSIIQDIANELKNCDYELIKEMYVYLLKDIPNISFLQDKNVLIKYTKKLMSVKVTKQPIYYKKIVLEIKDYILTTNIDLNKFYTKTTNMTRYNFNLSIAIYLTMHLHFTLID